MVLGHTDNFNSFRKSIVYKYWCFQETGVSDASEKYDSLINSLKSTEAIWQKIRNSLSSKNETKKIRRGKCLSRVVSLFKDALKEKN